MVSKHEKHGIEPEKIVERSYNGCAVRIFFNAERNETAERAVLSHLMMVFDRKIQGLSTVRS